MKYYKNDADEIFAYEDDGSQDGFIRPGLVPITQEEFEDLRFPAPIIARQDGSYVITNRGYPYHVPNNVEFAALWAEVDAFAKKHPEKVEVEPPTPPPTPEEQQAAMQAAFTSAIQDRLDVFARTRGYDGILSAATYATSTVPQFRAEGQYAVEARDMTWASGYAIMGAVLSGERPMPTLDEVFAELPALNWPAEL